MLYISEYILKHDTVDDVENDTLTYTLKKTWIFKPELSNGLTGDENVTILHPGTYPSINSEISL